jgi:hypothetical protein
VVPSSSPPNGSAWLYNGVTYDPTGLAIASDDYAGGVCNVKNWDFGAVGNLIADDTAAIQNAINAAGPSGCGTVHLPSGFYKITSSLNVTQKMGISIVGDGPTNTVLVWEGGTGGVVLNVAGVSNSTFANFSINGTGDTTGILYNGLLSPATATTGNLFDRVYFNTGFSYGVRAGTVAYQADQTTFRNCSFYHCNSAGVSIEDANAVRYDFQSCSWQYDYDGITAIRGTGGQFGISHSFFGGNTNYDISVYPNTRGTALTDVHTEGSYRFLRTASGSTGTTVTCTECGVHGITDNSGAGTNMGIGILWESSGSLNLIGGEYVGSYQGSTNALQIWMASNNFTRSNINIVGSVFDKNPFQTTSDRYGAIFVVGGQLGTVMNTTAPSTTAGFVARGTQAAPINFVAGNTMIWSPSAWLYIPSGTVLQAGDNVFTIASNNCQGNAYVVIDTVTKWGGLAPGSVRFTPADAGGGHLQVTVTVAAQTTLTDKLEMRVTANPEPYSIL